MEDWQKEIPPESAIHATKDDKLSALISCKSSQTFSLNLLQILSNLNSPDAH